MRMTHQRIKLILFVVFIFFMIFSVGCYPTKKRKRTFAPCSYQILERNKEGYKNTKKREKLLKSINKKRAAQRD